MAGMARHVCAFSDDGRGVQDAGMMREAMQTAKGLGGPHRFAHHARVLHAPAVV